MATKAKAVQAKEEAPEKEAEGAPDSPLPLLDLNDAGVKKMIKAAKKRGYVTYEQLNAVMPSEEVTSEQIEDTLAMLNEMGINVVENEEAETDEDNEKAADEARRGRRGYRHARSSRPSRSRSPPPRRRSRPSAPTIPCACICAKWARSSCLSREGEIAIAKRIEAGREAMIAGLCESPLTFQAVIIWRDELNDGKVFLRDIIDLEATYAGPDAKQMQVPVIIGPDGKPIVQAAVAGATPVPRRAASAGGADAGPAGRSARRHAVQGAGPKRAPPTARSRRTRARPPPRAITTKTTWRIRSRSRRSKPSSSPRSSRPSTTSPTPSSGCAACRSRTSSSA